MRVKKPVNLSIQVILSIIATIIGPSLLPISTAIATGVIPIEGTFISNISTITMAISGLIFIIFFQIHQLKKGVILFVLLWLVPAGNAALTYFVSGIFLVAFNQHDNGGIIFFVTIMSFVIIIGGAITYYVYKLSVKWNKQFLT